MIPMPRIADLFRRGCRMRAAIVILTALALCLPAQLTTVLTVVSSFAVPGQEDDCTEKPESSQAIHRESRVARRTPFLLSNGATPSVASASMVDRAKQTRLSNPFPGHVRQVICQGAGICIRC